MTSHHTTLRAAGLALLPLLAGPPAACAQEREPTRHALIICGISGDAAHYRRFWTAATHLRTALTEAYGYNPRDVWLLFEETDTPNRVVRAESTLKNIGAAFAELKQTLKPQDSLLVLLLGHTDFDGRHAKFNIKGRDLSDTKLAELANSLPACRVAFVVATANSGYFLPHLSRKGRVVITATKVGREVNEAFFPYAFIRAFSDREADANHDGRLTLAEAFTFAVTRVKAFYEDKGNLRTEHALLDDNGDKLGSRELTDTSRDGKLAREFAFEVVLDF